MSTAEQELADWLAFGVAQAALTRAAIALSEDAHADGEPWVRPSGAHDAYPLGAVVDHGGKSWESLVSFNVWEPGDPGNPVSFQLWRALDVEPGGEWDPNGHAYEVDDEVTFEGSAYRCLQAHTSQPGWTPAAVPALWLRL